MKKTNKKSAEWLKKAGFLEIDDLATTDYNKDVSLDDLETINFNNDTQMTDLTDIDEIDLKKTSATLQAAKKTIKIYRNFKRKNESIKYGESNKKKQIPMNLRDRLKKLNRLRKTDEVKFIKQLPFHPAERLKRKENRNLITTKG